MGSELLAAAGRPSGGLLTPDDLASPRPGVQKASSVTFDAAAGSARLRRVVLLPWANIEDAAPAPPVANVDVARSRAVVAVDRNATFAIAVWDEATDGIMVEELGLRAPFYAEPVRRGQTRVKPGDPRAAAAAVALVGGDAPEVAFAAFGASDAYDVVAGAIRGLAQDERIEAHGHARLVALSHAAGAASVFRS